MKPKKKRTRKVKVPKKIQQSIDSPIDAAVAKQTAFCADRADLICRSAVGHLVLKFGCMSLFLGTLLQSDFVFLFFVLLHSQSQIGMFLPASSVRYEFDYDILLVH